MATGKIVQINNRRGMLVALLDDGSYSVIEILGYSDLEIGTAIRGEIDDEGSCTIRNIDTTSTIDVVVQNAGCNFNHAIKRAGL